MPGFIQKLLGYMNQQKPELTTRPLPAEPDLPASFEEEFEAEETLQDESAGGSLEPPQLIVGCAHNVGQQRDHNEDALFTLSTALANHHMQMPMPFGLFIVADGMGGHRHGEVASSMAVSCLSSYVVRKLYVSLLNMPPTPPDESVQEILHDGIQEAHRSILKEAPGGGTTLTAVLILGEQVTVAHVGDSRAYFVTNAGHVISMTRDHSLVNRLVELGQITVEEAAVHPQRNVLYRALGQGEPFDPDVNTFPLAHNGHILLCSDGLWGVVPEEKIAEIVGAASTPLDACQQMIDAANEAGGPDNITAVLVRISR